MTFRDPEQADGTWVVYDANGWLRGSASSEEAAWRLKRDAEAGELATPILDPPHYEPART